MDNSQHLRQELIETRKALNNRMVASRIVGSLCVAVALPLELIEAARIASHQEYAVGIGVGVGLLFVGFENLSRASSISSQSTAILSEQLRMADVQARALDQ